MYKFSFTSPAYPKCEEWMSPNHFAMALMCWCFGLTNTWKFTELIYRYGNVAVLIPYIITMMLLTVPLIFTELAIGQYTNTGVIGMWRMAPIWQGVGLASSFLLIITTTYYHHLTSQTLFYFMKSFELYLPWAYCKSNEACTNLSIVENYREQCDNCTLNQLNNSVEYFYDTMRTPPNGINWFIIISSVVTLMLLLMCMLKLIKSLEKVLSLLTLIPFLQLIVLMLTSLLYRGSYHGLAIFLTPNFNLLLDIKVWGELFNIHLITTGLGLGGLISIASHSHFRTNIFSISIFLPLIGVLMNVVFTIFVYSSFAGYTRCRNVNIHELFNYDKSLLFIKIPMVLLKWPFHPQIWSLLYFSYLYLIGFRTTLFMTFTLVKTINDGWKISTTYTKSISAGVCIIIFFLTLIYNSCIGRNLYISVENISTGPLTALIILLEFTGIFYIYGSNNFINDIHFMLNRKFIILKFYWDCIPLFCLNLFIYFLYKWIVDTCRCKWQLGIEITLLLVPILLWLSCVVGYWIVKRNKSVKQILGPHVEWGNRNPELRRARDLFRSESIGKEFTYRRELYSRSIVID